MSTMHEVDYKISGDDMQYVEVELDPMEAAVAEAGGMMYMTQGIQMQTVFGDPSQQNQGFLGKVMSAGKRVLTGESLFITTFTAVDRKTPNHRAATPLKQILVTMLRNVYVIAGGI